MNDYIQKAIRTESIEGAKDRLLFVPQQIAKVDSLVRALDYADDIKKFIYYGKPTDVVDATKQFDETLTGVYIPEDKIRLLHAGLGMLTEAAEFLQPVIESIMRATELDRVNLREELGDSMWYQAIACDVLNTTFEVEQERNINKLQTRYPEKFTTEAAITRDLDAERKVLEDA